MFEALFTVCCLRALNVPSDRIVIFWQDVGDGDEAVFASIKTMFTDDGVGLRDNGADGFGTDLWASMPYLGLRQLGTGPFAVIDPGSLVWRREGFDEDTCVASKSNVRGWPDEHLYGPSRGALWIDLANTVDLNVSRLIDPAQHPASWRHWPSLDGKIYFGADAAAFGARFAKLAKQILGDPPAVISTQDNRKALRQIVLPLAHVANGGELPDWKAGESAVDGVFPASRLVYLYAAAPEAAIDHLEHAVAPNQIKKLLKQYEPAKKLIYQGKGRELRKRFFEPGGQDPQRLIKRLKRNTGWWVR